ncbi:hypothetical protein Bca101_074532 [Brassica carinata]
MYLPNESLDRASFAPVRLRFVSSKTLRIHQFIAIKKHLYSFDHQQAPIKHSMLLIPHSGGVYPPPPIKRIHKNTRISFLCLSVHKIHQDPNFPYSSTHPIASHKSFGELLQVVIMRDRVTGCDHGFGFFFFVGPSVPVRAILLYVKLTDGLSDLSRAVGSHRLDRRRFTVWIITLLQRNDKKRCYA